MSKAFKFKKFTIQQKQSAFKIGTDGVLLGAWANCSNAKRVLDIGTGTGLIALMIAQRSQAQIDAIEIDSSSVAEAELNFFNSSWSDRLDVYNIQLQEYYPKEKYDLIVSNPPFFSHSLQPVKKEKAIARHTEKLPLNELFEHANRLLEEKGILCIILPVEAAEKAIEIANEHSLYLQKLAKVLPTPDKPAKRWLMQFGHKLVELVKEELVIEESGRHQYSQAYRELTKDFYLNF